MYTTSAQAGPYYNLPTRSRRRRRYSLESLESDTQSATAKDDADADEDFNPRSSSPNKRGAAVQRSATRFQKASTRPVPRPAVENSKALATKANQKTSNASAIRSYASDLESAVPGSARLPPCNVGAVELVTFFPHHLKWPEAGLRLYRNGWTSLSIAKAYLHARNQLDRSSATNVDRCRAAQRQQVIRNYKLVFGNDGHTPAKSPYMTAVSSYDASNYLPRDTSASLYDARLVDIARGVVYFPMNEDRGIVTQVIEHAVRNDLQSLTTADIPRVALQQGFQDPPEASDAQWDQNAQDRIEARIELTGNYLGRRFEKAYESESSGTEYGARWIRLQPASRSSRWRW